MKPQEDFYHGLGHEDKPGSIGRIEHNFNLIPNKNRHF